MPIREEQKTNKQHAVPQNIMDVEFKLIGELTMRQFVYLVVFALLAYGSYALIPTVFRWLFVIFFVGLGLGLAFVPLEERGLDQWIINFFSAIYSPNQRLWRKSITIPTAFDYQNIAVVKQELITLAPTSSRRKLEEYLDYQGRTLEVDALDIPEQEYAQKVRDAFASFEPTPEPMPTVTVAVEEVPEEKQQVAVAVPPAPPPPSPQPEEKPKEVAPPPQKDVTKPPIKETLPPQKIKEPEAKPVPPPVSQVPQQPVREEKPVLEPLQATEVVKTPKPPTEGEKLEIIKPKRVFVEGTGGKPQIIKSRLGRGFGGGSSMLGDITLAPITPDMHTGRRFMNLTPGQGRLVLPLRGQQSVGTAAESEIEENISKKAEQLQQLLQQVRAEHKEIVGQQQGVGVEAAQVLQQVVQQQSPQEQQQGVQDAEALYAELESLRESVRKLTVAQANAPQASSQDAYHRQPQRVSQLPEQVTSPQFVPPPPKLQGQAVAPPLGMKPLTNKPNVISGIVKKSSGGVLENIFIVIKNHKGEPVRALKTNALGQFIITTPLTNGQYYVEVDTNKKTKLGFDIISLELKGEVTPPLEVRGH